MSERFKWSLGGMWIIVGLLSLTFPIFLPSSANGGLVGNPIQMATATMFALSFPSSLLGIPLIIIADYGLGLEPWSIAARYANLWMLFVLGLIQWFWIAPRVGGHKPDLQVLDLPAPVAAIPLRTPTNLWSAFDTAETTPLERVLRTDE